MCEHIAWLDELLCKCWYNALDDTVIVATVTWKNVFALLICSADCYQLQSAHVCACIIRINAAETTLLRIIL